MRLALKFFIVTMLAGMAATATHADALRIGFAAPLNGPNALLGRQMQEGAALAATHSGVELIIADDECSADGGEAAARKLVRANATIIVGFLCLEAIEAALPILKDANIPVITPAVRANHLTDQRSRTLLPIWRLAPRADAEVEAVAKILSRKWRNSLFAIVDDGTLYGRELAESLRFAAETAGLEPILVDGFRPQMQNQTALIGRLARAGATHVFVGGERDDIAIMARDTQTLDHEFVFAGGEALRAVGEIELTQDILMIGLPEWADLLNEGTREIFTTAGIIPEGYVLPAYAAVEIALQAATHAQTTGNLLADSLNSMSFETVIGTLAFDAKGDLAQNPFILQRYDGERFLPAE